MNEAAATAHREVKLLQRHPEKQHVAWKLLVRSDFVEELSQPRPHLSPVVAPQTVIRSADDLGDAESVKDDAKAIETHVGPAALGPKPYPCK